MFLSSRRMHTGPLPPLDHLSMYSVYESATSLLAFFINGISFFTVCPRTDDYSGFIVVLCSGMDMICLLMSLFERMSQRPTGEFRLTREGFFETVLETHFTLLFFPVILKLLLMIIHMFMQAVYWFDTLRPQKFDITTDFEEINQTQLWINIKIKLSKILLLQCSYPALLVALPLMAGFVYPLTVFQIGWLFNWTAPLIPPLSAITLILFVPLARASFMFPFRCRKRVAPVHVSGPINQSYALPI